jgi:hypothetical protein
MLPPIKKYLGGSVHDEESLDSPPKPGGDG